MNTSRLLFCSPRLTACKSKKIFSSTCIRCFCSGDICLSTTIQAPLSETKDSYDYLTQMNRFESYIRVVDVARTDPEEKAVGTIRAMTKSELRTHIHDLKDEPAALLLQRNLMGNEWKIGTLFCYENDCWILCCGENEKEEEEEELRSLGAEAFEQLYNSLPESSIHSKRHNDNVRCCKVVSSSQQPTREMLSYLLGSCYTFTRYKQDSNKQNSKKEGVTTTKAELPSKACLFWSSISSGGKSQERSIQTVTRATYLVRDLISTPAQDMSPYTLQTVATALADRYKATHVHTVIGDDLLTYNGTVKNGHGCGMIHAVGRAATSTDRLPRLIDLSWKHSNNNVPTVTLVGKGVTYDTGGLNLKSGSSMRHMKKDMGGAAHVLGLAIMLIETQIPIHVRVLIPAVENVMGYNSYRPGDVLTSVNGITTEVENTDAEGRLILGDALALASSESPDLIVDFATLTGAARTALGQSIPALFTNQADLGQEIQKAAWSAYDPVWRLPLWQGYEERINKSSQVADLTNVASDGLGGAITAALYLKQFVGLTTTATNGSGKKNKQIPWVHVDLYGMMPGNKTGIGEAQGMRTMFQFLQSKYAKQN